MKIIVDGFGGDNAPEAIVEGAVLALEKYSDITIVLTGDESKLKELVNGRFTDRIEYIHTTEIITNDDVPTEAIKTKKQE